MRIHNPTHSISTPLLCVDQPRYKDGWGRDDLAALRTCSSHSAQHLWRLEAGVQSRSLASRTGQRKFELGMDNGKSKFGSDEVQDAQLGWKFDCLEAELISDDTLIIVVC